MQNTIWNEWQQSMIIEEDYFVYNKKTKNNINIYSQSKEIQWILQEWNLWHNKLVLDCTACKNKELNPTIIDCCAGRLIANQPDFLAQKGKVQQKIESHGHKVFFIILILVF